MRPYVMSACLLSVPVVSLLAQGRDSLPDGLNPGVSLGQPPSWYPHAGVFRASGGRDPTRPTIWLHAVSVGDTRASQPLVAALRESSILFATLIAVMWLKEPLKPGRIAGAGVVALGLAFMRLA